MVQDKTAAMTSLREAFSSLPFAQAVPDMEQMLLMGPHFQASMMKILADRQGDFVAFLRQRCEEDKKFADKLAATTSLNGVYSACVDFFRNAASHYATEASKAAEANSKETMKAVETMQARQADIIATVAETAQKAA